VRKGDRITFVDEIMALVDQFLAEYGREHGPLESPAQRALVASYVLGVMRTDVDALWDGLAASPLFGRTDPRALFAERAVKNGMDRELFAEVDAALAARGWKG